MRKLIITLATALGVLTPALVVAMSFAVGSPVLPALADHVAEPTGPITGAYSQILHYANPKYVVPCENTSLANPYPFPFIGTRLQAFVGGPKPSEHFNVRMKEERAIFGPQGGFLKFEPQWSEHWVHANIPPHATINNNPDVPWFGMWLSNPEFSNTWYWTPGVYKQTLTVTGQETGTAFTRECFVEVPEGAAL